MKMRNALASAIGQVARETAAMAAPWPSNEELAEYYAKVSVDAERAQEELGTADELTDELEDASVLQQAVESLAGTVHPAAHRSIGILLDAQLKRLGVALPSLENDATPEEQTAAKSEANRNIILRIIDAIKAAVSRAVDFLKSVANKLLGRGKQVEQLIEQTKAKVDASPTAPAAGEPAATDNGALKIQLTQAAMSLLFPEGIQSVKGQSHDASVRMVMPPLRMPAQEMDGGSGKHQDMQLQKGVASPLRMLFHGLRTATRDLKPTDGVYKWPVTMRRSQTERIDMAGYFVNIRFDDKFDPDGPNDGDFAPLIAAARSVHFDMHLEGSGETVDLEIPRESVKDLLDYFGSINRIFNGMDRSVADAERAKAQVAKYTTDESVEWLRLKHESLRITAQYTRVEAEITALLQAQMLHALRQLHTAL